MTIPKAFVSYSHDSQQHKKWVLDFATRLRNTGVDAILDQWELKPGDDVPHFMEQQLVQSDRVLMICTPRYVEKANAGAGGVGYEKMIVTADLMRNIDTNKIIPIIRQDGTHAVPTFLRSKLFLDFSRDEQFESSFDDLARSLHDAPLFKKPPVGNNPFAKADSAPAHSEDALVALMRAIAIVYQASPDAWVSWKSVLAQSKLTRIMFDVQTISAKARELVWQDKKSGDFLLTDKGKSYIVQNKLDR